MQIDCSLSIILVDHKNRIKYQTIPLIFTFYSYEVVGGIQRKFKRMTHFVYRKDSRPMWI